MVADGRHKPPDLPPSEEPQKRAWSNVKNHIVVKYGKNEYGYDTQGAVNLLRQLEDAIRDSI